MPQIPDSMIERLRPGLRTLQVITLAMVMGQVLFVAAIMAATNTEDLHMELKMLIFLAAVTGVVNYAFSFFFSPLFRKTVNASDPPEFSDVRTVTSGLQTAFVVQATLITGGVYLNLLVFLLDKGLISLVVAAVGGIVLLLLFPTLGRYVRSIEKQLSV